MSDLSFWAIDNLAKADQPEFAEIKLSPSFGLGRHDCVAELDYRVTGLQILASAETPAPDIFVGLIVPYRSEEQGTQTFAADSLSLHVSSSNEGVKTTQRDIVLNGADLSTLLDMAVAYAAARRRDRDRR